MNSAFRRWSQLRNQQLLTSLRDSILDKPPFITGTLQLPDSFFSLFYKVAQDSHAARHINLANTTSDELEQLTIACQLFHGTEHNVGKMDTECFSSTFDPFRTDLTSIIHGYLLEGKESTKKIKFQPHELNIYRKGSFAKSHVDTPQSKKKFGSVVIEFPTFHEGGALSLRRHGHECIFDPSPGLDQPSIGYVAFLNDIEQDVAPVTSGHRVTLTYDLYFDDDSSSVSEKTRDLYSDDDSGFVPEKDSVSEHFTPPKPLNQDRFREAFKALLENPEFMADGGMLGFGPRHGYSIPRNYGNNLKGIYNALKGSDAVIYQSMRVLGFEPVLHMYYEDGNELWGTGAIVDDVVGFDDLFEESTTCEIAQVEGGILVEQDNGSIYKGRELFEDPEPVQWVTPMTTYSRKEGFFISHEDTGERCRAYGNLCMIVRIGKAGDRLAYPIHKQVRRVYQNSGYHDRRQRRYY